jgi:D-alanine--(R)-lactate ligase
MGRRTIAILFGGCSEEHDVSVKSAIEIAANIDTRKYAPVYVGITRSGVWKLSDGPAADWEAGPCTPAVISPDRETHGLLVEHRDGWRAVPIDAVFPVLHGRTGEDGAVQGLLELSGIPYVGCDIQSSATCMDKSLAYVVARSAGIDTPEFVVVPDGGAPVPDLWTYPVFVKPARSGSSFGVTRVERADEMRAAVAAARRYDDKVVLEQAIRGTEVGCAVLGNGAELAVGAVDQIELRHGIFRIHQEATPEQGSENAVITVPAPLPDASRARIQATAKEIYTALGCRGLARVDMFLQDDGRIVLNEVNTLPGFTAYSRYPRMMAAAGVTLTEVIDRCIALAMAR